MMPDLPIPVTTTRPLHCRSSCTAQSNRASRRSTSARIAAASVSRTFCAKRRPSTLSGKSLSGSATQRHLGLLDDRIDGLQPVEQSFEEIEPEGVLRVALRPRRLLVHFEEHTVHASGDAG